MVGGWLLRYLPKRGVCGTFEVGFEVCVWGKELLGLDIFVSWRWALSEGNPADESARRGQRRAFVMGAAES